MPFELEEVIDFRNEDQLGEAREWATEEQEKWKRNSTLQEQETIDRMGMEDYKIMLNDYIVGSSFFTDIVYSREELESRNAIEDANVDTTNLNLFTESQKIQLALERNILASPIQGYAELKPLDLGINFDLRSKDSSSIPIEALEKVKERLANNLYPSNRLIEVKLNSTQIYDDSIVKVNLRVPSGENYGIINTSDGDKNVILSNKVYIKPTDISIGKLLGKDFLFINADAVRVKDFGNLQKISWGKEAYEDYRFNLNSKQIESLSLYVKGEYTNINSYLRTGILPKGQEKEVIEKRIEDISSALAVKPIPEDITLYRRVGQVVFGYESVAKYVITFDKARTYLREKEESIDEFSKKWLGKELLDKGFMSTSISSGDVSSFQNYRFIFRIHATKGTNGAYVTSNFDGYEAEQEVLLDRNSSLKINRITPIKERMGNRTTMTKLLLDMSLEQKKDKGGILND